MMILVIPSLLQPINLQMYLMKFLANIFQSMINSICQTQTLTHKRIITFGQAGKCSTQQRVEG